MPDVIEVISLSDAQVEIIEESGATVEVLATEERIIEIVVPGPQGPEPTVAASINYVFDGGSQVITTGLKGSIIVPFACTINSWTIVADPVGSIVIDIWKTTLANYPADAGDTITGGSPPTIMAVQSATSSSLGAWDTTVAEGDVLSFMVDSVTSVTLASIALKVTRQ